jgi:DNA repair photolyase
MLETVKHYTDVKKVLIKSDLAQPFIPSNARFSPYRACAHACKYCDGRAEKYFVEGDFERDVVIRRNLPELLRQELTKLREPVMVSIGSGVSDPYQPVEHEEKLMAQSAAILDDLSVPATVATKSSLPMRDIEIWSSLNRKKQFFLIVSLTMLDDSIRRTFEPHASPVKERLDMLRAFKARGCRVGVLAMPLLPYITDTEENIHALWKEFAGIGVDFAMPGGLTLRPGVQKETFLDALKEHSESLAAAYRHIYREERPSGSPDKAYNQEVSRRLRLLTQEYGISEVMPHAAYRNHLPVYDEIYVLLSHMVTLYHNRGIDVRRLETSIKRYAGWFLEYKKQFNRHRSQKYIFLEELLREQCRNGSMTSILDNRKLADFISRVVLDRSVFDYARLELSYASNVHSE